MLELFWYYIIGVNLVALCLYGIDKRRAMKAGWRIPEATLLGIAFIGGSLGAWVAMELFRHKTKHWKFKILVPLFFLMQVTGIGYIIIN